MARRAARQMKYSIRRSAGEACAVGTGADQAEPEAHTGEPAEMAADGVGLAVFLGQGVPGQAGDGDAEHAVDAVAGVRQRAALAHDDGAEMGEDLGPFGVGHGGPGAARGVAAAGVWGGGGGMGWRGSVASERTEQDRGLFSFLQA